MEEAPQENRYHLRLPPNQTPGCAAGQQHVSIKILQDDPDRKIWESIFIRDLSPTLNTQTSSWPLIRTRVWPNGEYQRDARADFY